jgi:hypothetical protein
MLVCYFQGLHTTLQLLVLRHSLMYDLSAHYRSLSHTIYSLSRLFHAWADKFPCIPTRMSRSVGTHDKCANFISTKVLIKKN